MAYTGLPEPLKKAVFFRDGWRCRWCGVSNYWGGYDAHHIDYRRGYSYDRFDNLITLCRKCHDFVHDSFEIPKVEAQNVLTTLIADEGMGLTGLAVWRQFKAAEKETGVRLNADGPVGRLLTRDEDNETTQPGVGLA